MAIYSKNSKNNFGVVLLLVFLLVFVLPSFAFSQSETVKKLFSYPETINGEIVAQNNFVYLGSDEGKLYVIREKDGKLVWEFDAERKVRLSPEVARGFVYAGMNDGSIVCLNAFTGEVQWSHLVGVSTPIKTSLAQGYYYNNRPVFYEDKVFFLTFDNSLSAFSKEGKKLWSHPFAASYPINPVVAGEKVVTGNGSGLLVALDLKGKEIWQLDLEKPIFSLAVVNDEKVVVGLEKGGVRLIDVEKGKQVWSKEILETVNSFLVSGNLIYASTLNGNLCTFSKDGTLKWKFDSLGSFLSRALKEGDNLYIGSNDGRVYVLDPVSGESKWAFDTKGKNVSSVVLGRTGVLGVASFEDVSSIYSLPKKMPVLKTDSGITIKKTEGGFFLQAVNFYVESYERIKDLVATYGIENFSPFAYPSGIFAANFRAQTIAENTALKRMSFWQTFSLNLSGLSFFYAFVVSPGGVYLLESIFSFAILFVLLFAGIFGILLFTGQNQSKFVHSFGLVKQVILKLPKHLKLVFFNSAFLLFSFGLIYGISEMVDFKKESWFIPLYSLIAWLLLLIFGSLFSSFNLHFISLSKKPFKSALASWSKSFLYFTVCLFVFSLVFMVLRIMIKFSLSLTLLTAFLLIFFVFTYFGGLFVILGNGKVYRALKDGFSLVWRNSFEVLIFMLFALLLLILPILISLWITNEQLIILFVIVWGAISMTLLNLFAFEIISSS